VHCNRQHLAVIVFGFVSFFCMALRAHIQGDEMLKVAHLSKAVSLTTRILTSQSSGAKITVSLTSLITPLC
jgi:hypothetical protein